MKRNDEEHWIQCGIIRNVGYIPECQWLHAIPNGGKRDIRTAKRLKDEGVKDGVHDLFLPVVCYQRCESQMDSWTACGLYIEVKAGKNKLTPKQREFKEYAENNGYKCVTVWSVQEGVDAILKYLGRMK